MKKINVLAIVAMLVGGGFAFANTSVVIPDHFMDPITGQWEPLELPSGNEGEPGTYSCKAAASACTGAYNPSSESFEVVDYGIYVEN